MSNTKRIQTYLTEEKNKQFHLQLIREGDTKPYRFARKLLKLGIEKYNQDLQIEGTIKGHMNF